MTPPDHVCAYCHHPLTQHYGPGDIDATGCARLGCPCLHSDAGPGISPAEAALVEPRVRSIVTTLGDLPGAGPDRAQPTDSHDQKGTL